MSTAATTVNAAQFAFGLSVLPVSVTDRDITHGVSRDCISCAVARALNRTLPRYGFMECHVRLVPYACFADADGLEILTWDNRSVGHLPAKDLPDGLVEWAMDFDEWAEFNDDYGSDIRSWRESRGKDADVPFRPTPTSFVFNFGKLRP